MVYEKNALSSLQNLITKVNLDIVLGYNMTFIVSRPKHKNMEYFLLHTDLDLSTCGLDFLMIPLFKLLDKSKKCRYA